MYIEQLYTDCLSQYAYYIESAGEAVVVDPMRETSPYTELAKSRGARIKYIFETHFHTDFVSGHLELSKETGAAIVFGPGAVADYDIHVGSDGEEFPVGKLTIRLLHTPGHTLESSCFLLLDDRQTPHSIFTGDTVFVGDVGRPDLAVTVDFSREQLAGMLFDSVQSRIMPLPNYVNIYPGHGAGSACGKSIGFDPHSTIGEQKHMNYALRANGREDFIRSVTEGLSDPPQYYLRVAAINRHGYRKMDEVLRSSNKPLSAPELTELIRASKVMVLDSRAGTDFCKSFIPGALNVGLNGSFAVTSGIILEPEIPLVLVTEPGRETEAIMRLARIGMENVAGYLQGGMDSWNSKGYPADHIQTVNADEFEQLFRFNYSYALDVRNPDEWVPGFVAGAQLIPLGRIEKESGSLDKNRTCFVYCAGGYRSVVAASLLRRKGFRDVRNVVGGMNAIRKTKVPVRQLSASTH